MEIRNSIACIYFSLIIEGLSLIQGAKNLENLLYENHTELRRIFQESRKKRIVAYNHPDFFNCFKRTYKKFSETYDSKEPLNYIPLLVPAGLVLAYGFRRKEKQQPQTQNKKIPPSHSL